jgi:hypothetical protein
MRKSSRLTKRLFFPQSYGPHTRTVGRGTLWREFMVLLTCYPAQAVNVTFQAGIGAGFPAPLERHRTPPRPQLHPRSLPRHPAPRTMPQSYFPRNVWVYDASRAVSASIATTGVVTAYPCRVTVTAATPVPTLTVPMPVPTPTVPMPVPIGTPPPQLVAGFYQFGYTTGEEFYFCLGMCFLSPPAGRFRLLDAAGRLLGRDASVVQLGAYYVVSEGMALVRVSFLGAGGLVQEYGLTVVDPVQFVSVTLTQEMARRRVMSGGSPGTQRVPARYPIPRCSPCPFV